MAIIHSCCCWKSLRTGSFACGIYSLFYYFVLVVVGTFHVDTWGTPFDNNTVALSLGQDTEVARPVSIVIIICSAITIFASIILLVGLRMDNRIMLIPWVFMISVTTLVDFVYTAYSIGTTVIYPAFAAIVTIDFFICLLNIYCIVCVVSQYQEYKAGRGTALHDLQMRTFGGVVGFSANGDRVQFLHGKAPTNPPPKVVALPGIRRVPQVGHVNGHHQQHASKVLGPISECSNGDEVPLNGVVADVINDHVTLDAIGGSRSQPPPPRLANNSDVAWKSAALIVDDHQQLDGISCGVDDQNASAIERRVKFSSVVAESFAVGSKAAVAAAIIVDDNDSDTVIKMVVSTPTSSPSESSSTTSASCDPEHSHDSCKSTEPISHEPAGFAPNSAYSMSNSESSSDQRFSNATTTTHETLPLLNQTTDGTT